MKLESLLSINKALTNGDITRIVFKSKFTLKRFQLIKNQINKYA